jgi:type IV pilus assembly protein PilY1
MRIRHALPVLLFLGLLIVGGKAMSQLFTPTQLAIAQAPLFTKAALPPLNMLVMGKDHKIYFSAYNDTSDLDGDGVLDVGYRGYMPKRANQTTTSAFAIDYYGYFNSYVCYSWSGTTGESASGEFIPVSKTTDKTCGGTTWSGDFLNYLTTSRIDALRKVLYGGYRKTDDADKTVLEGAFFPQDGHSWGKEYQSVAHDGYDIRQYAPLPLPATGKYHLFAVTTTQDFASTGYNGPLFRVLQNTPTRVYNWLSIEAPVAGNKCFNSSNQRVDCVSTGGNAAYPGHPATRAAFDTLQNNLGIPANLFGSGTIADINCNSSVAGSDCNPYGANDNFMAIMQGTFSTIDFSASNAKENGTFEFAVDGDDAIDMQVLNGNTVVAQAGYYDGHGLCNCTTHSTGTVTLARNASYTVRFRMEEAGGGEAYILKYRYQDDKSKWSNWIQVPVHSSSGAGTSGWDGSVGLSTYNLTPPLNTVTRQDYRVRVQVCTNDAALRDDNCKLYPNGNYKPTGILHDYGESDRMYFGLITGSQQNNIEGGILRRNITSFASEINSNTGQFRTDVMGIARSISALRMIGGAYGNSVTNNYSGDTGFNWGNGTGNCGGSSSEISNGNCRMWGNPVAEMLYESMRYFAGADAATPRFVANGTSNGATEERNMGLSTETWRDPYRSTSEGGYPFCAKPYQTIFSDINPSYDGDLPGSGVPDTVTTKGATPEAINGFSATDEANRIWNDQFGGAQNVFIGEVNGVTDYAPTPKLASSFADIRGLSPEEPTKKGTYYTASVARFAHLNDVNAAQNAQKVSTYAIALASPLPKFQFGNITILPFGKTVSGTFGGDARKPTNTIVALYIDQVENLNGTTKDDVNDGRPYASFRISYEDVEQGNDFDMDAIVRYVVTQNADGTVTINLTSEYAAGSANQNLGYVISGTTRDGVYLEVRDSDSGIGTSVYALNTPAGVDANGCAAPGATASAPCNAGLTLNASRTFTPSDTSAAVQLKDPLWYAAKFGGFIDSNNDGIPQPAEWDANDDGVPDNYFLVTNPLTLRSQLEKAFDTIQTEAARSGSLAISGAQISGDSFAVFPSYSSPNGIDWVGDLTAYRLTSAGQLGAQLWSAAPLLPATPTAVDARKVYTATAPITAANRATEVKEFRAANLGTSRAAVLARLGYPSEGVFNVDFGADMSADSIVNYLRGDRSLQGNTVNVAPYRARSSIMGDVINSAPVISSKGSNFGWSSASGLTNTQRTAYTTYVNAKASKREYAFVGANDGMLHAFNDDGTESFAYVPNALLDRDRLTGLGYLANRSYAHRYYVDGKLTLADALLPSSGAWGTVLVGGLGAGQKGAFGLNVTNPATFGATSVLWEINDHGDTPDPDIGLVMGQPIVVPLDNGTWVTLFGNGYNSTEGDPVLYVVNVETGELIRKIKPTWRLGDLLNATSMNGLGNLAVADTNSDGLVDTVYGGDLQGNVWKFDLSAASSAAWNVAYSGNPLFTAKDPDGNRQPITGGFELSVGPNGGYMVYFGTGRYFATGDNSTTSLESVYGIWDNGTRVATGRTDLAQQEILSTDDTTPATRSISTNAVNYLNQRGWYMDLALTDSAGHYIKAGERMIGNPRIQSGRIYLPTYIPGVGTDCVPGGTNWLYGLNPLSGAAALGQVAVAPSNTSVGSGGTGGVSSGSGAPSQGVGVTQPSATLPTYCDPAEPDCDPVTPPNVCSEVVIDPINPTASLTIQRMCGRQSWRQLR